MLIESGCLPSCKNDIEQRLLEVTAEFVNRRGMSLETAKRLLIHELRNPCEFEKITWSRFMKLVK